MHWIVHCGLALAAAGAEAVGGLSCFCRYKSSIDNDQAERLQGDLGVCGGVTLKRMVSTVSHRTGIIIGKVDFNNAAFPTSEIINRSMFFVSAVCSSLAEGSVSMRLIIDTLVALMLAAILAGVVITSRQQDDHSEAIEATQQSIRQFLRQISLQQALERVEFTSNGFPTTIDPKWFKVELPQNELLKDDRPWLEVAGPEQRHELHPYQLIGDAEKKLAKFWYNPYLGIVRARVSSGISDAGPLEMYNTVNRSHVVSLIPGTSRTEE